MKIMKSFVFILLFMGGVGVSADELALRRAYLKKYDLDGDGRLNKPEYLLMTRDQFEKKGQPGYEKASAEWFAHKDANQDGFVTAEEMLASQEAVKAAKQKKTSKPAEISALLRSLGATKNKPTSHMANPSNSGSALYWKWVDSYGLDKSSNDPDGDGLSNLIEYALGANPIVADADGFLPEESEIRIGNNTRKVYVYRRRRDANECGIHYLIECNPAGAAGNPALTELNVKRLDAYFEEVTVLVPQGATVQLRVKID